MASYLAGGADIEFYVCDAIPGNAGTDETFTTLLQVLGN